MKHCSSDSHVVGQKYELCHWDANLLFWHHRLIIVEKSKSEVQRVLFDLLWLKLMIRGTVNNCKNNNSLTFLSVGTNWKQMRKTTSTVHQILFSCGLFIWFDIVSYRLYEVLPYFCIYYVEQQTRSNKQRNFYKEVHASRLGKRKSILSQPQK